jgi:hypothetical protein
MGPKDWMQWMETDRFWRKTHHAILTHDYLGMVWTSLSYSVHRWSLKKHRFIIIITCHNKNT